MERHKKWKKRGSPALWRNSVSCFWLQNPPLPPPSTPSTHTPLPYSPKKTNKQTNKSAIFSYLIAFENYGKKKIANAAKFGFSSGTMRSDVILLLPCMYVLYCKCTYLKKYIFVFNRNQCKFAFVHFVNMLTNKANTCLSSQLSIICVSD